MMYELLWLFNIFVIDKVHSINISTACTAIYLYNIYIAHYSQINMRYTIAMVVNTISTVIERLSCMNTSGGYFCRAGGEGAGVMWFV